VLLVFVLQTRNAVIVTPPLPNHRMYVINHVVLIYPPCIVTDLAFAGINTYRCLLVFITGGLMVADFLIEMLLGLVG